MTNASHIPPHIDLTTVHPARVPRVYQAPGCVLRERGESGEFDVIVDEGDMQRHVGSFTTPGKATAALIAERARSVVNAAFAPAVVDPDPED